jgi:hypothetical protein
MYQVQAAVPAVNMTKPSSTYTAVQRRAIGLLMVAFGVLALVAGTVPCATAAPPSQYVRTESGRVPCALEPNQVGCEASGPDSRGFLQAPISMSESYCRYSPCPGGIHAALAVVTASGAFRWSDGNIGEGGPPQNDLVLIYGQPIHVEGWTIDPVEKWHPITNDGTGHGMFVSIENVSWF